MSSSSSKTAPVAPVKPSPGPHFSSKGKEAVFSEGENVLCFHGNLVYEARVQAVDKTLETPKYLIHYMGWNTKWDEWADPSRILKYTERNLERKRSLLRASVSRKATSRKKAEASSSQSSKSEGPTPAKSKPKIFTDEESSLSNPSESDAESQGSTSWDDSEHGESQAGDPTSIKNANIDVRIKIPEELNSYLVDDWDYIIRQKKLVKLPARITVEQILKDYLKSKATGSNPHCKEYAFEASVVDVTRGFMENFNAMLGTQLLYKLETEQYADYVNSHKDVPLGQIYGAIHFLRMFVKLGSFLSCSQLSGTARRLTMRHANDFLSYVKKNASSLFRAQDYIMCPPEYNKISN